MKILTNNHKKILHSTNFISCIVIILFLSTTSNFGQSRNTSIELHSEYRQGDIAVYGGFGQSVTNNDYFADCSSCRFNGGVNTSFTLGSEYYYYLSENFFFGGGLFYDYLSVSSSYRKIQSEMLEDYDNELVNLTYKHNSDLGFNTLNANAFAGLRFGERFFLKTGISLGVPLTSKFIHDMELMTKTTVLSDGQVVRVFMKDYKNGLATNPYKKNIQNSEYPDISIPAYWDIMTGFSFNITDYIAIVPQIQYSLALLPIATYQENLYIHKWQFRMELLITHYKKFN